ncbi:MAG: hypothetical protein K6F00_11915 [Lachnospiraceae bacterium]|nr:hypothetical protein [Lachnospiraceae bacterium]
MSDFLNDFVNVSVNINQEKTNQDNILDDFDVIEKPKNEVINKDPSVAKSVNPYDIKKMDLNTNLSEEIEEIKEEDLKLSVSKKITSISSYRDNFGAAAYYASDTAELGKKSFKSNTPYKRERNDRIQKAKNIHKNATAYTLEIHDKIAKLKADRQEEDAREMDEVRARNIIKRLMRINFTNEMFYGTNIRQNFSLYMSYVMDFKKYNTFVTINGPRLKDPELLDNLLVIKKVMRSFTDRMESFCQANKINLNGEAVKRGDEIKKSNRETAKAWSDNLKEYNEKKDDHIYMPAYETVTDFKQKTFGEGEPQIIDFEELSSAKSRVSNINKIKFSLAVIDNALATLDSQYSDMKKLKSGDNVDVYKQWVSDFGLAKRQKTTYTAYLRLAYKEYKYFQARNKDKDDPAVEGLLAEAKEAWNELSIVKESYEKYEIDRFQKDNTVKIRESRSVVGFTKQDALLTSNSVNLSMDAKEEVKTLNTELRLKLKLILEDRKCKKAIKNLIENLDSYYKKDLLNSTISSETDLVKDLRKSITKANTELTNSPNAGSEAYLALKELVESIKTHFDKCCDGGLEIPEDAVIQNCSDQSPAEIGQNRGSKRTGLFLALGYNKNRKDEPLFPHEPTMYDFKQRAITNCYMCSAVMSLVEKDPSFIKKCIKDNGDGTATVRLYDKDENGNAYPTYVRVTKTSPRIMGADIASSGALWMSVLERAMAFHGRKDGQLKGYRSLWYGMGAQFMFTLTGKSSVFLYSTNTSDDHTAFENLLEQSQSKVILCGSNSEGSNIECKYVQPGHAYAVVGLRIENGQRLIKLRNPYGTGSCSYDYGKSADTLSKNGLQSGKFDYARSDDASLGTFEMKWEDFSHDFDLSGISICDYKQEESDADLLKKHKEHVPKKEEVKKPKIAPDDGDDF